MANHSAAFWISHLNLQQHIEGGHYGEVYRSDLKLAQQALPASFNGDRHSCTHIYFLLQKGEFSAFHRIQSDELWHFYAGEPLVIYEIETNGLLTKHILGSNPLNEESPFCYIKAGSWFASQPLPQSEYSLVGCTVSPGFDFADFELAKKDILTKQFPDHTELISGLCRL